MNFATRASLQSTFATKHARQHGEPLAYWRLRLEFACIDINDTLRAMAPVDMGDTYIQRLYIELDEVRAAQLRASRAA